MKRLVSAGVFVACIAGAVTARAQPANAQADSSAEGPILPERLAPPITSDYWVVGVAYERFGNGDIDKPVAGQLLGLSVEYRLRAFAPHVLVMANPGNSVREFRSLAGLGMRGYWRMLGTEWSYGVGGHVETRLDDHYYLIYATPLELGCVLYSKNSWRIELFAGARRVVYGKLINHYLLDPNGFDSEPAQNELDDLRDNSPWKGFLRVVFGRRID